MEQPRILHDVTSYKWQELPSVFHLDRSTDGSAMLLVNMALNCPHAVVYVHAVWSRRTGFGQDLAMLAVL